jgi:hypothetical protein
MTAQAGYKGSVRGQTGIAAAFVTQACTDLATPVARQTYQITDVTKRFWDTGAAVLVERSNDGVSGWTTVSAALYTIQYLGGKILFLAQQSSPTFIRVSASAYPMAEFAGFTEWSADMSYAELETTALSAAATGNTDFIPGLFTAKVSASGWWVDSYFFTKLTTGALCVLSLMTGNTDGGHYDCYAFVNKLGISDKVDDLITEDRDFTVTAAFYFNQN